ncbi:MAG TPA: radical SAM protein [bacterium]|nr:radical SAM protein [bacterium]
MAEKDHNPELLQYLYEKARQTGHPLSAHYELTYRCNLACKHCYLKGADCPEKSTEDILGALETLAGAGVIFLTLTGGEPLIREDFFDIASHARKLNFALRIFTNGTLIDNTAADMLAGLNPFEIGISIYGAGSQTHDSITGVQGSFEKSLNAVSAISSRGIRTTVKSVLMKQNFDEYEEMIELAGSLGASYTFDPTVFPCDNRDPAPLKMRLNDSQLEKVLTDRRLTKNAAARCRGPVCDLNHVCLGISPSGEIFPCIQLRRSCGNIFSDPVDAIVKSIDRTVAPLTDEKKLELCYNCELKDSCTRCPGLALLEDGSETAPSSWACRIARIREKVRNNEFSR